MASNRSYSLGGDIAVQINGVTVFCSRSLRLSIGTEGANRPHCTSVQPSTNLSGTELGCEMKRSRLLTLVYQDEDYIGKCIRHLV